MGSDKQQQYRGGEFGRWLCPEETLDPRDREVRLAARQVQLDLRPDRVAVVLGPDQQFRRFGQPTLPYPQVGQAYDGGSTQRAVTAGVQLDRGDQLPFGVVPAARGGQHAAV